MYLNLLYTALPLATNKALKIANVKAQELKMRSPLSGKLRIIEKISSKENSCTYGEILFKFK